MLRFDVAERCTMARVTEDNGEVWTDSCVEFFIAPDDSGYYYNFECSCIGRLLLGFRKEREHPAHAAPKVMAGILRTPSLGLRPFPEHEGDNRWSVVPGHSPAGAVHARAERLERPEGIGEPLQMRRQTFAAPFSFVEADRDAETRLPPVRFFRTN